MEFTILDYHILNLLAENSMATEHIIKSRLHQNISNILGSRLVESHQRYIKVLHESGAQQID